MYYLHATYLHTKTAPEIKAIKKKYDEVGFCNQRKIHLINLSEDLWNTNIISRYILKQLQVIFFSSSEVLEKVPVLIYSQKEILL